MKEKEAQLAGTWVGKWRFSKSRRFSTKSEVEADVWKNGFQIKSLNFV
jgi:hypothetical protein